jgi:hypothetical protein
VRAACRNGAIKSSATSTVAPVTKLLGRRRLQQGAKGGDGPTRLLAQGMTFQVAGGGGVFVVGHHHGAQVVAQAGVLAAQNRHEGVHLVLRIGQHPAYG